MRCPCHSLWPRRPLSQHTNTLPHTSYYHLLWGLGCPGNWWCHNTPALLIISPLVKQSPPVRLVCVLPPHPPSPLAPPLMFNFSFRLRWKRIPRRVSRLWSDTFWLEGKARAAKRRGGDFRRFYGPFWRDRRGMWKTIPVNGWVADDKALGHGRGGAGAAFPNTTVCLEKRYRCGWQLEKLTLKNPRRSVLWTWNHSETHFWKRALSKMLGSVNSPQL